ncbi:uncharacterized protein TNCV_3858981 [Trichonephila clavipes]|nr:uncharacterized protein TNCV_3858981 [Trichonephila clavipes]
MTSRKRMEEFERWHSVRRIEAGQSITYVDLFFSVHHSVISRLWKQFQTTQTVVRRSVGGHPRITTSAENRYIAIAAKRNRRAASTHVACMVTASIVVRLYLQLLYADDYILIFLKFPMI